MKIFTLLFSFYLLGLACLPCADREECIVKANTSISAPIKHDKHSQDTEHCTPFCTCSCCAASVSFQAIASYKIPKGGFSSKRYSVYNISFSSEVSFSIWQPPKLS